MHQTKGKLFNQKGTKRGTIDRRYLTTHITVHWFCNNHMLMKHHPFRFWNPYNHQTTKPFSNMNNRTTPSNLKDNNNKTWAMLMMRLRNFGCSPASFFSLAAMGLLRVFNASVPSFNKGRTITDHSFSLSFSILLLYWSFNLYNSKKRSSNIFEFCVCLGKIETCGLTNWEGLNFLKRKADACSQG